MKRDRVRKVFVWMATAAGALLLSCAPALAQCALCKSSVASSNDSETFAQSLNLAVLVLLIPPVLIFCAIFILAFKYRKAFDEGLGGATSHAKAQRR